MNKDTPTPGCWIGIESPYRRPVARIETEDGRVIAELLDVEGAEEGELMANLRLLSAAKDLLDALKNALGEIREQSFPAWNYRKIPAYRDGMAAIAKAEARNA